MTEEQANVLATTIGAACSLYHASATLAHASKSEDSNNAAKKARLILNRALTDAGIDVTTSE